MSPWCLQKAQATEESQIPDRFNLAHITFCSLKDGINSHPRRLTTLVNVAAVVLWGKGQSPHSSWPLESSLDTVWSQRQNSSVDAKNRLKGGGHRQTAVEQGSEVWAGNFWLIRPNSPSHTIPVACHFSFRIQLSSRNGKESVDLCSPPHLRVLNVALAAPRGCYSDHSFWNLKVKYKFRDASHFICHQIEFLEIAMYVVILSMYGRQSIL